jgi:hypothetical protein
MGHRSVFLAVAFTRLILLSLQFQYNYFDFFSVRHSFDQMPLISSHLHVVSLSHLVRPFRMVCRSKSHPSNRSPIAALSSTKVLLGLFAQITSFCILAFDLQPGREEVNSIWADDQRVSRDGRRIF